MIKRILVALDPDADTPVATRYAIRLAKRFDAELTGLAVVDTGNLHSMIGVGGYGTEHAAREIWVEMTEETQKVAQELMNTFKKSVEKEGLRYRDVRQQGASAELIIEEMKYHDLLVLGRDSRFFYSEPDRDTQTLAKVVKGGVAPTLVVTEEYRDIENVMIAFDGSSASAKSLKAFVHLLPYGKDIEIDLVNVAGGLLSEKVEESDYVLRMAENYLKAHNFNYVTKTVLEKGEPGRRILDRQLMRNPDLLLMGAHSVSAVKRAAFGSTTHYMITSTPGPLFLSP